MQVFGIHHQFDVPGTPLDVEVTAVPPRRRHVHAPHHLHLFSVVGIAVDREVARHHPVFRTAFHLEGIVAQRKHKGQLARHDKMVIPEWRVAHQTWPARRVLQMHPTGNRLARLLVGHRKFQSPLVRRWIPGGRSAGYHQTRHPHQVKYSRGKRSHRGHFSSRLCDNALYGKGLLLV